MMRLRFSNGRLIKEYEIGQQTNLIDLRETFLVCSKGIEQYIE